MKYKLAEGYVVDVDSSIIAKRIAIAIEYSELTYQQLEEKTGIPKSAIQRYATGQTQKIPDGRIYSIAKATRTSPFFLFGQTDEMTEEKYHAVQEPLKIVLPDGSHLFAENFKPVQSGSKKNRLAAGIFEKVTRLNEENLQKVDEYIDLLLMRQNKEK